MADIVFWQKKTLAQMNPQEWDSLCDGCGKCCLSKLEDEDNGDVYYTKLACEFLDVATCRCQDYDNRLNIQPECMQVNLSMLDNPYWLPTTCAYRLLAEKQPLPDWHPLITGNPKSVHNANISISSFAIHLEKDQMDNIDESYLEEQIINWVI